MNSIDRKRTMETASNNTWESKTATKRALPVPRPSPKFTVTYSRLCDGGAQEMSTAVCAIREVFPDASISTYRRTSEEDVALGTPNPEVVITDSNCNNRVVWSSKQKNLYQKYPKKRKKSISQIRKACEALQTTTTPKSATSSTTSTKTVAARVIASAKKLSPRASSLSPRPSPTATIPLPTSLNIIRPPNLVVHEVSEDFSTTAASEQNASCELDENGVCTNVYNTNPLR